MLEQRSGTFEHMNSMGATLSKYPSESGIQGGGLALERLEIDQTNPFEAEPITVLPIEDGVRDGTIVLRHQEDPCLAASQLRSEVPVERFPRACADEEVLFSSQQLLPKRIKASVEPGTQFHVERL